MTVYVSDTATGQPIVNASVAHFHMREPHFITGTMDVERLKTDENGAARFSSRDGKIEARAKGYMLAEVYSPSTGELNIRLSKAAEAGE